MQGHGNLVLKFSLNFFFALNVPAKQGRKLREKLRGKLRDKLRPELPPSKTETSPKTSLCRNPLLTLNQSAQGLLSDPFPNKHALDGDEPKGWMPSAGSLWFPAVFCSASENGRRRPDYSSNLCVCLKYQLFSSSAVVSRTRYLYTHMWMASNQFLAQVWAKNVKISHVL